MAVSNVVEVWASSGIEVEERVSRQANDDLELDATVEKVTDYPAIVEYGVMSTPALVVDEKVVSSGRVPTAAEVREVLTAAMRP